MIYRAVLILAFSAELLASSAFAQQSAEGQELLKLEYEWGEAIKQHDTAVLERILADDFIFTDAEGQVWNKAQYIPQAVRDTLAAFHIDDERVRLYGETGVVTSVVSWTGTYNGKGTSFDVRYTDVFVKRDGHWQCVAAQDTFVAKPAAQDSQEEQELLKREHEWAEAYQQRDTQTLDRLLAADFIFTDDEGKVYDKPKYLAVVLQQVVTAYTLGDMRVRVYGDTGIVTSPSSWHYTIAGTDASGDFRSTDVFVKQQGRWLAVVSQDTRITTKP